MKFPLLNIDGSKTSSIELSDKLVKLKVNYKLIKFVIDWQLNHAKPRIAKTKQRNQIKGSTKKLLLKKEVEEQDMQVKRLQYLLEEVLHYGPKGKVYKVKK